MVQVDFTIHQYKEDEFSVKLIAAIGNGAASFTFPHPSPAVLNAIKEGCALWIHQNGNSLTVGTEVLDAIS